MWMKSGWRLGHSLKNVKTLVDKTFSKLIFVIRLCCNTRFQKCLKTVVCTSHSHEKSNLCGNIIYTLHHMAGKRVRNERVKVFIYSTCIYDTSRCSSDLVPFSCCILHLPQHPPAEGVVGRGEAIPQ